MPWIKHSTAKNNNSEIRLIKRISLAAVQLTLSKLIDWMETAKRERKRERKKEELQEEEEEEEEEEGEEEEEEEEEEVRTHQFSINKVQREKLMSWPAETKKDIRWDGGDARKSQRPESGLIWLKSKAAAAVQEEPQRDELTAQHTAKENISSRITTESACQTLREETSPAVIQHAVDMQTQHGAVRRWDRLPVCWSSTRLSVCTHSEIWEAFRYTTYYKHGPDNQDQTSWLWATGSWWERVAQPEPATSLITQPPSSSPSSWPSGVGTFTSSHANNSQRVQWRPAEE